MRNRFVLRFSALIALAWASAACSDAPASDRTSEPATCAPLNGSRGGACAPSSQGDAGAGGRDAGDDAPAGDAGLDGEPGDAAVAPGCSDAGDCAPPRVEPCDVGEARVAETCVPCPLGTAYEGGEEPRCLACEVGNFCAGGALAPARCPEGSWDDDDSAATACVACEPGVYCAGGAAPPTACVPGAWDHDDDAATPCREQTCWRDEAACDDTFVSVWQVGGEGAAPELALSLVENGTYNFTVSWGDGTRDVIAAWDAEQRRHRYAAPGRYTVTIEGKIEGFSLLPSEADKLLEIQRFGSLELGDTTRQFRSAAQLQITATDAPGLARTTSLSGAFEGCAALADARSLSHWDVSSVTDMSAMFSDATRFNADIGRWDVSSVTTMFAMFAGASSFNRDIGAWDVSSVTDMALMFVDAERFDQDLDGWDVSAVTDMSLMFNDAVRFNGRIGSWDVSSVTDMSLMFLRASRFNDAIGAWDVSSVSDMYGMFSDATELNQDLGSWDVSAVESMSGMFSRALRFDQDLGSWDVSNVWDMEEMFEDNGLSTAHYDAVLRGWSTLPLQRGVIFDAGLSTYSPAAESARAELVERHGWTVNDLGLAEAPTQRAPPARPGAGGLR